MGNSSGFSLIGFFVALPFVIVLIYIVLKYGSRFAGSITNGNLIKVVERVPLSQNSFLYVVLIDNKPYIVTNGEKGAVILMELKDDIIEKYDLNNKTIKIPKFNLMNLKGRFGNEKIR